MRTMLLAFVAVGLVGCDSGGEPTPANDAQAPAAEATAGEGAAVRPSFDCARAEGQAQQLVCNDPSLAQMDVEVSRLYALAEATEGIEQARLDELRAMQRGWIKGRDDCWKADDLRECVMAAYAFRVHELRQGYANARSADAEGISTGPYAFLCDKIDAGISGTFVNGDPGAVALEWLDKDLVLERVASGSGAKYAGRNFEGVWGFWTKGDEALLTHPQLGDLTCTKDEIG